MKSMTGMPLLLLAGCGAPHALPDLGDPYALHLHNQRLLVASGQTWPYEERVLGGFLFEVATNDQGRVAYLATRDPAFKTPERISTASTLEEVLKAGAAPPWYEPGWAHHTRLPSGWSVAFQAFETRDGRMVEAAKPTAGTKVAWLFKRR